MTWKRHAEYHDKNRPYVDQIDLPFVPDYSTSIAQFQAGAIWAYAAMKRGDVLAQKQRTPELVLAETLPISFGSGHIQYGWQPAGRSPFRDERVRQACSYAIDRDLYIETFSEAKAFEAAGIPVQTHVGQCRLPRPRRLVARPQVEGLRPQRQVLPARRR